MNIFKRIVIGAIASVSSLLGRSPDQKLIEADASFYAREYIGKKMANGQPYNPHRFTVATWDYPLGAILRFEYRSRAGVVRTALCEVTDRGPAKHLVAQGRRFDLSLVAFRQLENPKTGVIRVTVTRIK